MTGPSVSLLQRRGCHLCEDVAEELSENQIAFESVDIDADPDLLDQYGDAVPVLLVDGREVARAPIKVSAVLKRLRTG